MQQSIAAAATKTTWQHVGEQQPQEVGAGQAAGAEFAGFGIAIAEAHLVSLDAEHVGFAEYAAVEVAGKVGQRVLAIAIVSSLSCTTSSASASMEVTPVPSPTRAILGGVFCSSPPRR